MPRRRSRRSYWPRYVPVVERRRKAKAASASLRKRGRSLEPVEVSGRAIAQTFWGKAWCDNLEHYSDFANRLPRGRTYVRNGFVIDLKIAAGEVLVRVAGSRMYRVAVKVRTLPAKRWRSIVALCTGRIDSAVELLQGRLSDAVMDVVTRPGDGLFPEPQEIAFSCTCPDVAYLCKHVAAALYGIGARLDHAPELLFVLRGVSQEDLLEGVGRALPASTAAGASEHDGEDLGAIFGIELDPAAASSAPAGARADRSSPGARRKTSRTRAASPRQKGKAAPRRKARPPLRHVVSSKELVDRGVPRSTIHGWLRAGVLEHTGERGVYRTTVAARERISRYRKR